MQRGLSDTHIFTVRHTHLNLFEHRTGRQISRKNYSI